MQALAGIKLREYAGLGGENGRLRSMERFLSSENEYVGQLTRIVDCILERPEADFFVAGKATLTLEGAESVTSCVTDAASALGELSGKARDKMQNIINSSEFAAWNACDCGADYLPCSLLQLPRALTPHFFLELKSNPPSAWPSIIKGLGTVALFLKVRFPFFFPFFFFLIVGSQQYSLPQTPFSFTEYCSTLTWRGWSLHTAPTLLRILRPRA